VRAWLPGDQAIGAEADELRAEYGTIDERLFVGAVQVLDQVAGSGSSPSAWSALPYSDDQRTTNVVASGADADCTSARWAMVEGTSGSLKTAKVKRRSLVVNGVPSCHFTFGWIFQVRSIDPSGFNRQVPFSTDGFSRASRGS
jgi:hypothetical protein